MGLSLKKLGRSLYEALTPQNEGAQRKAESILAASNQRILQGQGFQYGKLTQQPAREQFVQQNQAPKFNLNRATLSSFADTLTKPSAWRPDPVNVGSFRGSGLLEEFINSPFKVGQGISRVGSGDVGGGLGQVATGLIEGPAGLIPVSRVAQAGRGAKLLPKAIAGAKTGLIEGGVTGGIYGAGSAASQGASPLEVIKQGVVGGVVGGAAGATLGGAIPVAGAGLKKGVLKVAKPVYADGPKAKPKVTKKAQADLEKAIFGEQAIPNYKQRKIGTLTEKYSPNRAARAVTGKVEAGVNKVIRASEESGSSLLRAPGRTAAGISRQAGRTPDELLRVAKFQGGKELGNVYAQTVKELGDDAAKRGVRREAVAAALDPKLASAKGQKILDLTPDEAAEVKRLREIMDTVHETNRPLLGEERYQANKGKYFPRDFSEFFEDDAARKIANKNKLDLSPFKSRKDLSDIPKEVLDAAQKDPYYLAALSVQKAQRNKSFLEYSDWLAKNGSTSPGPRKGYIQVPDSPAYGALKGQYVLKEQLEDLDGFIYETNVAQNAIALIEAYDRNPLRRARKQQLTVFNPGVRVGNRTFNLLLSSLNGINPLTYSKNYLRARKMMSSASPEYLEATKQGIFGSTIIDKELYKTDNLLPKSKGLIRKAQESYSGVDDKGKMATYLTFRERGLSADEAARRTLRSTQNYDMVGQLFDIGAKVPVGGNAFVRFSSELLRLAHNTAADNPIRTAGAVMAATSLISMASKASGETPEDRKTREERVGAPRVPFTNQSLEVQTPWGAINIGRLLGVTTYNDVTGGVANDVERLLPFQSPVRKGEDGGLEFNTNFATSDPLLGPAISLGFDEDFRGKRISDPDAEKYPNQPLSGEAKNKNRLGYLKMAYGPLSNEIDSIQAAARGKENYYGKERSLPQALARAGGVRVEQFGPEQAKEQRDKNEYFSGEFKTAQSWLKANADLADDYNKFKGREKDRTTGKRFFDIVSPERWNIVKGDESGRLYDFLRQEALSKNQKDGQPIDPVFKLPTKEQQKQVLDLRSRPTGDDIETEEILRATQPWYSKFEKAESDYYNANTAYFKKLDLPDTQGKRAKEYAAIQYPSQPDIVKKYYQIKTDNADSGKQFYKNNADALSDAFATYRKQRLDYINAKRKIEGYPPLDEDVFNNVTFGYEDDERKVYNQLKYEFGGYGFGNKNKTAGSAYKYAVSLNSGGESVKPRVSVKKSGGVRSTVARKSAAAPKVTIKKSQV